jgi:hypothetical protein
MSLGTAASALSLRRLVALAGVARLALAANVGGCGSPEQVILGQGLGGTSLDGGGIDEGGATAQRVTGFVLVDVTTGQNIRTVADGDVINVSAAPVTLRAVTAPPVVGSVVFAVDGRIVRIEEHAPYSIAGDDLQTGKPFVWTLAAGTHRISATPYSAPAGMGIAGVTLTQTFQIQ